MKDVAMKRSASTQFLMRAGVTTLTCLLLMAPAAAQARPAAERAPALTISNDPLPPELAARIYRKPARAPETTVQQIESGLGQDPDAQTAVTRKVNELRGDLNTLQSKAVALADRLNSLEMGGRRDTAEYYASIATINTQLQTGTTPGNPRLISKLELARRDLERLSGSIAGLNQAAMEISAAASQASFLLNATRASYSLAGGVEEDHVRLAQVEDSVNSIVVVIDRMLNNVNDDITRVTAYVNGERENLRTLALAVQTGDLFGKSLSNRPFSTPTLASFAPDNGQLPPGGPIGEDSGPQRVTPVMRDDDGMSSMTPPPASAPPTAMLAPPPAAPPSAAPAGRKPLVKIRFNRPDVSYEQPVYMAVNEALSRYPGARFELVAVHPSKGNAAEVAIESTRARRDAERVLRSLTQMGLSLDRIDLSYMPSPDATSDEVHLYVR